jgi:hypothetical protein
VKFCVAVPDSPSWTRFVLSVLMMGP